MAKSIQSSFDFSSGAKIINLSNPTGAQDAATKAYVDAAVEGLAWKAEARVYAPANINVAVPGATVDGIVMAANDRVVLGNQTTGSENGIYIWNGAAVAMTRALDANAPLELENATVTISSGTSAGATFRQTVINITIGTTALAFASFGTAAPGASAGTPGVAALATQAEVDAGSVTNKIVTPQTLTNWSGRIRKFGVSIGDGSATSYAVTHNLNTNDVQVEVYRNSGAFDSILVDVNRTSVNALSIVFASAPAASAYRVVVTG